MENKKDRWAGDVSGGIGPKTRVGDITQVVLGRGCSRLFPDVLSTVYTDLDDTRYIPFPYSRTLIPIQW